MRVNIISLFPQVMDAYSEVGVVGQAFKQNLLQYKCINPRDYTTDLHKTVDDGPFGGGDGMLMLYEPLKKSVESIPQGQKGPVYYLSPQGKVLNEKKVVELSQLSHITLVCGRYGGVDQRFINEYVDQEISIGDYVLAGGELAALVLIEAVARKIPQVLGHADSSREDSFAQGLLEGPQLTRPQQMQKGQVPGILLSGHHEKIRVWREQLAFLVTLQKRPEILLLNSLKEEKVKSALELFSTMGDEEKNVLGFNNWSADEAWKSFQSTLRKGIVL